MLRKGDRPKHATRWEDRRLAPLRRFCRFRRSLLVGLSLLLTIAVFAPRLLDLTGAGIWILNQTTARWPGSVQVADLHLGWLRPVQIDELKLLGEDDRPLASLKCLRTDVPLWRLVTSLGHLGVVHAEAAEVWLQVRPGGSNWEDYLAKWPVDESAPRRTVQTQLQLHRGTIHLADQDGRADQVQDLEAWLDVPADDSVPVRFAAQAVMPPHDGASPGQLQVHGSWQAARVAGAHAMDDPAGEAITLEVDLQSLPLHLTQYAAQRYQQRGSARGAASGKCHIQLCPAAAQPIEQLTTDLSFAPLQIDLRAAVGELRGAAAETLELSTASLQLNASQRDGRTVIEQCEVKSPLASLALTGRLHLTPLTLSDLRAGMEQPAFELRGQVDLAAIARQAPRTMRLRDDVQLAAGLLAWEITNQPAESESRRLSGRIESRGLTARRGPETLRLDDPIEVEFQIGVDQQGLFAERLTARAPFLQIDAQGRFQQGRVEGQSDLSRLTQELGQYFDLGPRPWGGQIRGQARWQTTQEQDWQIDGELEADNLRVAGGSAEPWVDDQLQVGFQGTGRFDGWQMVRLHTATMECSAGPDRLSARLTSPLNTPSAQSQWPLDVRLTGELARWRSRVSWASSEPLPRVAGQIDLRAKLEASRSVVRMSPLEASLRDLVLVLGSNEAAAAPTAAPSAAATSWTLAEPSVELRAQVVCHVQDRQLSCESATLTSTSASVKAESLRIGWAAAPRIEGAVHFRGDLQKLWQLAGLPDESRAVGQWTGHAQLVPAEGGWLVEASSQITGFQWQQRDGPASSPALGSTSNYRTVWHEPRIQLGLNGTWPASQERRLRIVTGTCQSDSFAVQLAGTVEMTADPITVDLQGRSTLNLDVLSSRLRPWLGNDVRISGTTDKPFYVKGPVTFSATATGPAAIVPPGLEGQLGLGWHTVQAYGVSGGAGSLNARLRQQTLWVEPFQLPVSQGSLRFAPRVELFGPLRVVLEKGPVIEQISMTPEMCQRWLKYVAPLVADATAAEGRLSLQLALAELPLRAPRHASAAGALTIHQAHIGPGPLAREFLALAQTINTLVEPGRARSRSLDANARWIELPEQAVSFRVENGQVAHQNLTMQIGDVTIRTRGWVGFDQRLGLVAEVPVLDRWVANQPYLAGLRGQTLSIPVHGTLQQPTLDQRALQSLAQQTLRGAAQGLLQQELQRQMEQLLPKK
jgi:translocation and assembly module TamB